MDVIQSNAHLAKMAGHYDRVYKSECCLCFCTPENGDGLYVNLASFLGLCRRHLELDCKRNACPLYLNIKHTRVPIENKEEDIGAAEPAPPTDKLVFDFTVKPKDRVEEHFELAVRGAAGQLTTMALGGADLPEMVAASIASIQAHDSAEIQAQAEVWEEERVVSKYANDLPQLRAERLIPMNPKEWRCDFTGVTDNLWLNLSTGKIGSGRAHFDGTGGNGAALQHYRETGNKYPLVVKLGTITPSSADVYSYADDEDEMVTDPKLPEHLAHWGINMMQMEKTEKTMAELQHEKNMAFEFDAITEAGAELQPVTGQGLRGLKNLGNSCYMNSVLQVLWTIPELREGYVQGADRILYSSAADPAQDFLTQFAKVGMALAGPEACADCSEQPQSVTPVAFKTLAAKGHQDFSSGRQQDAQEYFNYLLDVVQRAEHGASTEGELMNSKKLFEYSTETRIECLSSHRVSYKAESGVTLLSLEIPLEAAVNVSEVAEFNERQQKRQKLKADSNTAEVDASTEDEKVLPKVPFSACLEKFAAVENIDNYYSAFLKEKTEASKSTRFASFPPYLMVHLRRYYVDSDWTPKKLEVLVDMPDHLSLQHLRNSGLQPGEELQPTDEAEQQPQQVANEEVVSQLAAMGFPESKCKKAALATGNANIEAAMEWLLVHGDDMETEPVAETATSADPDSIAMLESMGFGAEQAKAALAACQGSVDRAVDWLFSHVADADGVNQPQSEGATAAEPDLDGSGEYELVGFISHIGKNTGCGHYVCHIKKDGRWIIFNDEKVALSEKPPLQLGYMYLYKRL